jgi:hypothetical protein
MSISMHRQAARRTLIVGPEELFLLRSDPMITVLTRLEVEVEVSALGISGEESCVLLRRYIEVLVDLSTFFKFQFQHLLFRRIADAGDTAGVYRNALHAHFDADNLGEIRAGQLLFSRCEWQP